MSGPDVVCRGVGMILDGFLDSSTEGAMADQLGVSSRHLRRLFQEHVGVTPSELAKSTRAHFARRLLDDTDLTITEIAFAAGFGSVRQMNRVFIEIFRSTPTDLRSKRRKADRLVADGGLALRLPFEGQFDWQAMVSYFIPRAIPGVEHVTEEWYRRTVMVDGDPGVIELTPFDSQHLMIVVHLPHWEGLIHIARQASAIFGLTAPNEAARAHLRSDPLLGSFVDRMPGVRVPGTWSPFETAVLAIIGQENSTADVSSLAAQLTRDQGTFVPGLAQLGLSHVFPDARTLASESLSRVDVSDETRQAIHKLSTSVASGEVLLDPSQEMDGLISALLAIPGIEPSTAHYIAWRLGFRDAFPLTPVQLRDLSEKVMANQGRSKEVSVERWQPWRSLGCAYLGAANDDWTHP